MIPPIESLQLTLGYEGRAVIEALDMQVLTGQITVLVGSNGCGKSTLLKAFARLLSPRSGQVILNGQDIHRQSTAQVARQLSILPQSATCPAGMTVYELVRMGRYPYQNWLQQWSDRDELLVEQALASTGIADYRHQPVDQLSGGQRQRAWIAMTLAQDTDILLLDEPTTWLDLTHQIEVLDLLWSLNQLAHKTIVMVLHDLNLACRYAHHMIALQNRSIFAQGAPSAILTQHLVGQVFNLDCRIIDDPVYGTPLCIPLSRGRTSMEASS